MGARKYCQPLPIIFSASFILYFHLFPVKDLISESITMFTLSQVAKGLAALAFAVLPAVQASYPDPGACSGDCWAHDPALIKRSSDGTYFRFNTGSEIGIYKADSISGPWTYEGAAISEGSSIDLTGNTDLWVRPFPAAGLVSYACLASAA